ncbi:hypothetical protein MINT15_02530 [Saccharomonospora viridis]|uniref:Uncharacterized protein n=1 Tax=Saccharomonospora viridis TaxID=1852 RepID=A0A837DF81_9PSEU|nr:hypothetical protein MINT15_02530 [Saccharomonospora viridis]
MLTMADPTSDTGPAKHPSLDRSGVSRHPAHPMPRFAPSIRPS